MLCHAALLGLGALHFPQGTAGEQLPEATQSPFLSPLSAPELSLHPHPAAPDTRDYKALPWALLTEP